MALDVISRVQNSLQCFVVFYARTVQSVFNMTQKTKFSSEDKTFRKVSASCLHFYHMLHHSSDTTQGRLNKRNVAFFMEAMAQYRKVGFRKRRLKWPQSVQTQRPEKLFHWSNAWTQQESGTSKVSKPGRRKWDRRKGTFNFIKLITHKHHTQVHYCSNSLKENFKIHLQPVASETPERWTTPAALPSLFVWVPAVIISMPNPRVKTKMTHPKDSSPAGMSEVSEWSITDRYVSVTATLPLEAQLDVWIQ